MILIIPNKQKRKDCYTFRYLCLFQNRYQKGNLYLLLMKIVVTMTFLLLTICFTTFGQIENERTGRDNNLVFMTDSIEGVIFGSDFRVRYEKDSLNTVEIDPLKVFAKSQKANRFIPDIETIVQIEPKLRSFMRGSDIFIADSLHCYTKQYFGYIINKSDTIIYINCFFNEHIHEQGSWKYNLVRVFDGWHYYFNVKYNLTTKKFFDLWINGWG